MAVTDPREHRDDLLEWRDEETVPPATFAEYREMEAFRSGWVAVAYAFDGAGRVLLAHDEDEDHWRAPGGTLLPDETLAEGLRREVAEETGVEVCPLEARAVTDVVVESAETDASTGFTVVAFEATAESTAVGDDLGVDDEAIVDADWFVELPAAVFEREGTEAVLDRCEQWTW